MEILSTVIFLLVVISIWAFTTWRKLNNMKKLKEWVTWSVHQDDFVRYNIPLWAHFKDAQIQAHVHNEYRISGDEEWESVREIIEKYRNNLTQSYFDGRLWVLKDNVVYEIKSKDYFIFMLYVYLCEHETHGHNVVFHKMQYITYMYCKQNLVLQKNVPAWNEERLKKILDDDIAKERTAKQNPHLGNVTYNMVQEYANHIGVGFSTAQRLINAEREEAGLPPISYVGRPAPTSDNSNLKINWRN